MLTNLITDPICAQFRMLILHYTSLMNACALIDMRADDELAPGLMPINLEDPFLFRPNTTQVTVSPAQE